MSMNNIGGDWVESTDPSTGKVYYANTVTKAVSWEWPEDIPKPGGGADSGGENKDGWVAALDESSGKYYYHNHVTGETTWTRPEGFTHESEKADAAAAAAVQESDPNANPANWLSKDDADTGMTYYHNHVTGETTWTKPACLESTTHLPPEEEEEAASGGATTEESGRLTTESKLSALRQMSIEEDLEPAPDSNSPANGSSLETSGPAGGAGQSSETGGAGAVAVEPSYDPSGHHESRASIPGHHAASMSDKDVEFAAAHEKGLTAVVLLNKFTDLAADGSPLVTNDLLVPLENIRFVEFAETNYNFMRKGMLGFKTTTQKITSWKGGKDCIKTSLLNLNDKELVSEAVQCFRNITGWMGDRGSGKDPTQHCLKLLNIMLQSVDNLRNEVYCQICKQTTNNNEETNKENPMSNKLGWQLMTLCLASFPPGPLLKDYLSAHCKENMEDHTSAEVRKYAEHCLHCIPRIVHLGARRELPTYVEVEATKRMEAVTVRVSFLDQKYIMMPVNSWTTAAQFQNMIAFRLGVKNNQAFTVYEVSSKDEERPLDPDERILDLVAYWTRLNTEERSKKGKNAEVEEFHFIYKVRLFLNVPDDDNAAVEMMYIQATHDVVDARYPCSEQDSITLAALQVQEEFGDHPGGECRYLTGNLSKYLASKYMETTSATELEEHVLKLYSKLNGYSQEEARLSYLDYVKSWKIYGSSYYFAEPQNNKSFPPEIVLAVNSKGILIVDPERAETKDASDPTRRFLEEYPYNKVVTWGHSPNSFVIVTGNMVSQKKIYFKTEQGKEINRMVRAYVENLMKGKEDD